LTRHLFLKDGWIVKETTAAPVNILVAGEKIVAVGPDVEPEGEAEIVNASGLLVLPGLVDAHVHLREPGGEHKEDLMSGTRAALAGGITTVLAMPNTSPPVIDANSLANAMALADSKAVCDFGFFLGATPTNAAQAARLTDAVGLKMYMGSSTGSLLVDDFGGQYAHFKAYPPERPIAVHAEDEAAKRWFARQGQRRPPLCATLDTARALALAEHLGRRLHICHLSTAQELELVHAARSRGVRVTCEVAPHHLFLTSDAEWRLGPRAKMNPPLRSRADRDALWNHLAWIDAIASDHAPHTLEEKQVGMTDAPAGVPGLETTLPLLLNAVGEGQLLLSDVVRLTSRGPAEIFGLARKGRIAPGFDGDLVLVDFEARWTITPEKLWTKCGWTPFAGWHVKGRVERVYLRGRLAYADGEVLVEPGYGRAVEIARHANASPALSPTSTTEENTTER
jgi:dihydroorotase (multifunctional complex type)